MPSDIDELNKARKTDDEPENDDMEEADEEPMKKAGPKEKPVKNRNSPNKPVGRWEHAWFWPLMILITVPLVVVVFIYGVLCLSGILATLVIFGIPYLLGERRTKKFLIFGTVILIVSGVALGGTLNHMMYTGAGPFEHTAEDGKNGTYSLTNGAVSPYSGTDGTRYTFSITATERAGTNTTIYLHIRGSQMHANFTDTGDSTFTRIIELKRTGTAGNELAKYQATAPLGDDIYYHYYSASFVTGNKTTNVDTLRDSSWTFGPVNKPYTAELSQFALLYLIFVFMQVGLLYYVLAGMYWWMQKAKLEREKYLERVEDDDKGATKKKKRSEFTCSSCGGDVSADDPKCPKCGEGFDDDGDSEKGDGKADKDEADSKAEKDDAKDTGGKDEKQKDGKKNW